MEGAGSGSPSKVRCSAVGCLDSRRRVRDWLWKKLWSKVHSMETIQVVLDEDLLRAADRVAKRTKVNRSALVRAALREYLKRIHYQELERRDREGVQGPLS